MTNDNPRSIKALMRLMKEHDITELQTDSIRLKRERSTPQPEPIPSPGTKIQRSKLDQLYLNDLENE